MKIKLIQILLGAFGSALTVLLSHLASMPADVSTGIALSAGPAFTLSLGGLVENAFSVGV